jgi:two-component system response regulator YesN
MEQNPPDLVLCDILMPVMDGLELLRKAREAGFMSLFVMLTCMNEFEYARTALKHGAFDYILKLSMDVDTLRGVLAKANVALRQRARLVSRQSYYEYRRVYESLWEAMLPGRSAARIQPPSVPPMPEPGFRCVAVCAVHHGANGFTAEDLAALVPAEPDPGAVIHEFAAYGVTTFFYWSRTPLRLREGPRRKPDFPVAFCLVGDNSGDVRGDVRPLHEAWAAALRMLDRCWYGADPGRFLCASAAPPNVTVPEQEPFLNWTRERRWIQALEQGRPADPEALLDEWWREMECGAVPMISVKQAALQLDRLAALITCRPPADSEALTRCLTHLELLQALRDRLRDGETGLRGPIPATDHSEINKILEYVHRHYDEAVTLKAMARYVAMEEHYLSSLFKKKTGRNFIDYLHDVRIEQAKRCLDATDLTVNEIGRRVGFCNDNYFIKIFKRHTGMTPSQYRHRRLHQNA